MLELIGLMIIIILAGALWFKMEQNREARASVDKLKRSLEEMDEQAKLIVRTDMELNKTQEELDKKIGGLYALQKLSRIISTTLEESQVFKRIKGTYLEELGFEKACGCLWSDKDNRFIPHLKAGYLEDELEEVLSYVNSEKEAFLGLVEKKKTISSIPSRHDDRINNERIRQAFRVSSFVLSPILIKDGEKGFLFVGTDNPDEIITEGSEELITILTNQIGQAIENARLFETTWKAHQELEKKVEERTHELTLALEEVKKISKRKTEFISSVSHELRTPLTSIKGYAAILSAEKLGALPQAAKERIDKINRHSDELINIVNDLLDIARIESGKAVMKLEPQNLKGIISSVADLIMIQCKNKGIEMVTDTPKEIPQVMADRNQLERVFINLLGNAIKFTPQNGKITLKARPEEKNIRIDISDTGIGIPAEALPRLFEEFYRVDNAINQEVKGTGLGLSLVRHIILAHNGNISVESKVGKGTTFSFTLPLA